MKTMTVALTHLPSNNFS